MSRRWTSSQTKTLLSTLKISVPPRPSCWISNLNIRNLLLIRLLLALLTRTAKARVASSHIPTICVFLKNQLNRSVLWYLAYRKGANQVLSFLKEFWCKVGNWWILEESWQFLERFINWISASSTQFLRSTQKRKSIKYYLNKSWFIPMFMSFLYSKPMNWMQALPFSE
jgi:hypothetical protein